MIEKYNLFNESSVNDTFVLSDDTSSKVILTPDFYLGDVETYDSNATGIPYCDDNPIGNPTFMLFCNLV